ncbi:MAG: 7,8-didemethyl-8-hydroxy-5-deazariboflavin synthase [Actinobacteria bacterium]|nr:7,8-didemethyl-8-hydroxy-5-deazariboflavin synthase [Actinomycetota bacterium]NCZ55835.1 7,8-didemethyl-8-hydroxy-5-deazariboflavin synthase [Acidimicrobiia bacterium]NCX31125.1 7,8-didemethyl-8-hydroxy-5-deazariboflavin synthase [Actinomycetota bacterium]NCZ67011.1 7,8-didemethyl-8-hydroxy-5-deazariboflavin synthase [Acidimicrobiia bacterium]NCZ86446.1 7,8-didemethyl-8-hydroxy-5-deazariboflavin synthase [Actinomycetota bacterium]
MQHRHLLDAPLAELLRDARKIRDLQYGARVTYSPKVFIPLTMLCRDKCGYCTFAQPPARLEQPYLSPEQVLTIAKRGAASGCHEALFTLGERPELRYDIAADWLRNNGYDSTVHYLHDMAKLVLDETGLLPHANAGALYKDELAMLRRVSPSQGMMIETLRDDLECHRGAPDKVPQRRLDTLEFAGELRIPFTTGILVGIGESREDRIAALEAIAASHERHGHVQEVIVQNFLPKPRTGMQHDPACDGDEYLWSIAVARKILPPEIHLQAPPNLSDDFGVLLTAGIDDWGGVSPITADHVNPERPWPDLDKLRAVTEQAGRALAPRLTIYPEFIADVGLSDSPRWIDSDLRFRVLDRSDAEGLGRDDPGAVWPEKVTAADVVHDGAEVVLVGHRSTQWYSGANNAPPHLVGDTRPDGEGRVTRSIIERSRKLHGPVGEVLRGIELGDELGETEIVTLFGARGPEMVAVARAADDLRRATVGDDVTWVHNRNINYTNVCTFKCKFCGFSKGPLSLNLRGTPYLLTLDDIAQRAREAWQLGATEVTLQGGIHPDFDGDYYIDVTRAVKQAVPDMHVHGFTALEVTEGARRLDEPLTSYLSRLKDAGLSSLPGTAAEILDDDVRAVLCSDKVNTDEWLEAHRAAHRVGLRSNVTMMFGSIESPKAWAKHLVRTRALQHETGGFTEFVGLPFVHMASPIYLQRKSRRGPTFRETLLVHAVARLAYRGAIDNIQVSWVKIGVDGTRQLLQAGCNDVGGTLMNENISRAAGASHGQGMTPESFAAMVEPLGRPLRQRTTLYATR